MNKNTREFVRRLIWAITAIIMLTSVSHVAGEAASLEIQTNVTGEGFWFLLSLIEAVLTSGWLNSIGVDLGIVILFIVLPYYPDSNWLRFSLITLTAISGYSNVNHAIAGELRYGALQWGDEWYLGAWRGIKIFLFSVPLTTLPIALVEVMKMMQEDEIDLDDAPDVDTRTANVNLAPPPRTPALPTPPARTASTPPPSPPFLDIDEGQEEEENLPSIPFLVSMGNVKSVVTADGQGNDLYQPTSAPSTFTTSGKGEEGKSTFTGMGAPLRRPSTVKVSGQGESKGQGGGADGSKGEGQRIYQTKNALYQKVDEMNLTDRERRAVELAMKKYTYERIGAAMGGITKQAVGGLISSAKSKNPTLDAILKEATKGGAE